MEDEKTEPGTGDAQVRMTADGETVAASPDEAGAPSVDAVASPKARGPRIPLPSSLQEIVGSLLFASETPLSAAELRTCVRGVAPDEGDDAEVMEVYRSCTNREIEQALRGLEKELERAGCGFRLVCSGGAYRLQTASTCGRYVRALLKLDRPARLSRASLETLAIIAYRQPITKAEVEQIRGVAVDTIVKTLVDLQLVRLVGRSELPGHPFLYGTTPLFLEHFGLASLSDLNAIDPTLQRSDPQARAKLFVKPEKPAETADATVTAEEAPVSVTGDAPEETPEDAHEEESFVPPETPEEPIRSAGLSAADDDDLFIDDTPDEFDDEDDDEDDDEEDESEESEGEEEVEDESDEDA